MIAYCLEIIVMASILAAITMIAVDIFKSGKGD